MRGCDDQTLDVKGTVMDARVTATRAVRSVHRADDRVLDFDSDPPARDLRVLATEVGAVPSQKEESPMRSAYATSHSSKRRLTAVVVVVAAFAVFGLTPAQSMVAQRSRPQALKPTVVLLHGSWADASSWSRVISRLHDDGYTVRAIPNPLRSLSGDSAYVRTFLRSLSGPIVLVGHSYGGAVITNAATGIPNVKALVYVNAFAPDEGQSLTELLGPDSALSVPDPTTVFDLVPPTLPPSADTDLYLKKSVVFASFATGLSPAMKYLVWATQRPGALGGLSELSGEPAWRTIPSWYALGLNDKIIPASAQRAMAEQAGSTITEYRAGHLGLISDPGTVTRVIERAATACVRNR
jgi:pimeloyl-ACP methyl ester carboxylesterase